MTTLDNYAPAIGILHLSGDDYETLRTDPAGADRFVGPEAASLVVVDGDPAAIGSPGVLPVVVCAIGAEFGPVGVGGADLIVADSDLGQLADAVDRHRLAAVTLALVLRVGESIELESALAIESANYSMLQEGPEFLAWRGSIVPRQFDDAQPIVTWRDDDQLTIELSRPDRHNAITAQLRDNLYEALSLAVLDDSIERIVLRGAGPSFCSGGDLAEFGSRPDPASAHLTRLARSPARLLAQLSDRLIVEVHGATMGGGIEMAAFAAHVVADADTAIALPEVALGLIPGAGGTASLPRRIGRQRTAALALTGRTLDAVTALQWGLVDEIVDTSSDRRRTRAH